MTFNSWLWNTVAKLITNKTYWNIYLKIQMLLLLKNHLQIFIPSLQSSNVRNSAAPDKGL